jgi:hypothetical protein
MISKELLSKFLKIQGFYILAAAVCLFLSAVFFCSHLVESSQKAFWGDEVYGLQSSVRTNSYAALAIKGPSGQGSPAPLDYVALKSLDQIKKTVNYFSVSPRVYFRLWPLLVTVLAICIVVGICKQCVSTASLRVQCVQGFLLICSCFSFFYGSAVYYYAMEARPYALWNSFWLVAGVFALLGRRRLLCLALIGLALSATASAFQIISLCLAYIVVRMVQKDKFAVILRDSAFIFSIPFVVSAYYCFRAPMSGYTGPENGTWNTFLTFWHGELRNFCLLIAVFFVCFIFKDIRKFSILALAMLLLFFLGPLIYWVTRSKGFFFTNRQYMYYELANTMAFLTCVCCLPHLLKQANRKIVTAVLVLVVAVSGWATFRKKKIRYFGVSVNNTAQLFKTGIPYIEDEAVKKEGTIPVQTTQPKNTL